MPTDSSIKPGINALPLSTTSMSIEDLNLHNINYDTVLNSDKYMMNSSIGNSINVQGMSNYIFRLLILFWFLIFHYDLKLYDPASVGFSALGNHDQKSLTSLFPCDAPSTSSDETFAYSALPNQTNVSYTIDVVILSLICWTIICLIIFIF